ncbi:TPA: carbon-nitrogen hydrolase [Candidatus Woesearchaeota archaeon]|nr:carbon-nitrogen hydrolase [Candidatus Woesearchaeota archaeon]
MNKVKIGLIQTAVSNDIGGNLKKTAKFIKEAAKKGAQIVCLQELFATRYFAQVEDKKFFALAEKIPGKITNFLSHCAKENKITLVGGSFYEKGEDGKYYNTTLIFDSAGKIISKYRKVHIPHDPNYYEQYYFVPGNLGFVQVPLTLGSSQIKIAPLICYDQWFPEAARANALKGTQLIFYPTAIGWFDKLKKHEPFSAKRWENAMRGHASMNGIFVAAVNRVGKEDKMQFWGSSFIADPYGEVVARASSTTEQVLVAEIDLELIVHSQEGWGFLRNRKPKQYTDLVK